MDNVNNNRKKRKLEATRLRVQRYRKRHKDNSTHVSDNELSRSNYPPILSISQNISVDLNVNEINYDLNQCGNLTMEINVNNSDPELFENNSSSTSTNSDMCDNIVFEEGENNENIVENLNDVVFEPGDNNDNLMDTLNNIMFEEDENNQDIVDNIFDNNRFSDVSDDESDDNEIERLRQWAAERNIPLTKINELLGILRARVLPDLPKDARTFLGTSSAEYTIQRFDESSQFVYFGMSDYLERIVNIRYHTENELQLLFHFDGLSVFRSSSKQFWPILCLIYHKSIRYKPFPVALYVGDKKPDDINRYLEQFVIEINQLQLDGIIINDRLYRIRLKGFICDRPARALVKCIKNHNAYFACERCEVQGERVDNRTVYTNLTNTLRTHESFCQQTEPVHHTGVSPLKDVENCDMVKMFVLDFMHLGCLGIMKKCFDDFWLDNQAATRLSNAGKRLLSLKLLELRSQVPIEFQRTTRDLNKITKWKATEYRFFLLYGGPAVLKFCLSENQYEHFLLLHVACRLLSSDLAVIDNNDAKYLLNRYVTIAKELYGSKCVILNMHSLIHLADDAAYFQDSISNITAFPFENALGTIKKLLRSGKNPLAQVCRRLHERYLAFDENTSNPARSIEILSQKPTINNKTIITKLRYKDSTLIASHPNNTVLIGRDTVLQIQEIFSLAPQNIIQLTGIQLRILRPLLTFPYSSDSLQMWKVSRNVNNIITRSLSAVKSKMVTFIVHNENDNSENIYTMPLLHMED